MAAQLQNRASGGFGFAFSPSLIKDEEESRAGKRASRRTSTFMRRVDKRKSPLNFEVMTSPDTIHHPRGVLMEATPHKPSLPNLARLSARLSNHSFSPLFSKTGGVSPTFSLDLSSLRKHDGNSPSSSATISPPKLDFSASSVGSSSGFGSVATSAASHGLASSTFKEDSQDIAIIDHQLEMLEELFPREMKTYSGSDFRPPPVLKSRLSGTPPIRPSARQSLESIPYEEEEAEEDASSDYQGKDDGADTDRISQLLSDWPKLSSTSQVATPVDESALALAKLEDHPSMSPPSLPSQRAPSPAPSLPADGRVSPMERIQSSLGSEYTSLEYASSSERLSSELASRPSSMAESIASRRSFRPSLVVDTEGTKTYAVKELEVIKRMKEKGKQKAEAQAKRAEPGPAAVSKAVPTEPIESAVHTSPRCPFPDMTKTRDQTAVIPKIALGNTEAAKVEVKEATSDTEAVMPLSIRSKAHIKHGSTDSGRSGIVWSAVVEQFSELAQEIAGPKTSPKLSKLGRTSTAASELLDISASTDTVEIGAESLLQDLPTSHDANTASSSAGGPTPPEKVAAFDAESSSKSAREEIRRSETEPPSLPKMSSSSSNDLVSILKRTKSEANLGEPASTSTSTVSKRTWASNSKLSTARTRVVRIQSQAANVEGDYADFLKRASMIGKSKSSDDEDNDDIAETGSKYSKRSTGSKGGVENGLYRRGSMSSIVSRLTIATVGGASIKDMSRGSRFRRPSPFFANGHGYRSIHGPHQKGNPARAKRNSIEKRRSLEKRNSIDADESLLSTLRRVKEEKRNKAPTPSIGELSFENDEPAKAFAKKEKGKGKDQSKRNSRGKGAPTGPLPPHPAFGGGYAASAVLPSHRVAGTGAFSPPNAGYAASAIGISHRAGVPSSSASAIGAAFGMPNRAVNPFSSSASAITPSFNGNRAPASVIGGLSASRQQILASGGSNISLNHKRSQSGGAKPGSAVGLHHKSSSTSMSSAHKLSANNVALMNQSSQSALGMPAHKVGSGSSAFLQSPRSVLSPPQRGHDQNNVGRHVQPSPSHHSVVGAMSAPHTLPSSYISMTPSRSEISVKSTEREGWETSSATPSSGARSASTQSLPKPPFAQPQAHAAVMPSSRSSRSTGGPSRSSTAPLPALPSSHAQQLPLRSLSVNQDADNSRISSHRPPPPLSIDTEVAKAKARAAMKARQSGFHTAGRATGGAPADSRQPDPARASGSMTGVGTVFGSSSESQQRAKQPRSASTVISNMSNMFGAPKRPARPKESVSPSLMRYPRPPSAEPIDEMLDGTLTRQSTDLASQRSNSTSRSAGAVKNLFGRFGKKK